MKTKKLIYFAFFAALTAILSQISIPIEPVPINLALLSPLLAGGILGALGGLTSQIVYLALGAVGLPVFSNFSGGIGKLLGPTGGYLIGYLFAAVVTALLMKALPKKFIYTFLAMAIAVLVCYLFGTSWFMLYAKVSLSKALTLCVYPFIPADIIKIILAAFLTKRLAQFFNPQVL